MENEELTADEMRERHIQQEIKNTLRSDGWMAMRDRLLTKISQSDSISNLNVDTITDPKEILINIRSVQVARAIIMDWLNELYSVTKVINDNEKALSQIKQREEIIVFADVGE